MCVCIFFIIIFFVFPFHFIVLIIELNAKLRQSVVKAHDSFGWMNINAECVPMFTANGGNNVRLWPFHSDGLSERGFENLIIIIIIVLDGHVG